MDSMEKHQEDRIVKGVSKTVTITTKQELAGSVADLLDSCSSLLQRFKRHYYNIKHQFAFYRQLRRNMGSNECLIHVDFAENYVCKMATEIQSMHFGASKHHFSDAKRRSNTRIKLMRDW